MKQKIKSLMGILFIIGTLKATAQGLCSPTCITIQENQISIGCLMQKFDDNSFLERIEGSYLIPNIPFLIKGDRNIINGTTSFSVGYIHRESNRYSYIKWSLTTYGGISINSDSLFIGKKITGDYMVPVNSLSPHGGMLFLFQSKKWSISSEVRYTHMGNSADMLFNSNILKNIGPKLKLGVRIMPNFFIHNLWVKDPQRMYSKHTASIIIQHNFNSYIGILLYFDLNYNSLEGKRYGGVESRLRFLIPCKKKTY